MGRQHRSMRPQCFQPWPLSSLSSPAWSIGETDASIGFWGNIPWLLSSVRAKRDSVCLADAKSLFFGRRPRCLPPLVSNRTGQD